MIEVLIFFLLAVIVGLMFTFFGYPFFRVLLPFWGFFAGLAFGVRGLESLLGPGFISVSLGLIIGFFVGILLAALAYFAYAFAVYIFGASMGYVLGAGLMMALGFNPGVMTFVVGILGAVGITMLFTMARMPRFIIILFTAAGGAMAVIMGVFTLFGKVPTMAASLELTRWMVWGSWFWLIVWAVLAGFGMAFQYAVTSASEDLSTAYDWEKEYAAEQKKMVEAK